MLDNVSYVIRLEKTGMKDIVIMVDSLVTSESWAKKWENAIVDGLSVFFKSNKWKAKKTPLSINYEFEDGIDNVKIEISFCELHKLKSKINAIKRR